jgi:hypothetical protein
LKRHASGRSCPDRHYVKHYLVDYGIALGFAARKNQERAAPLPPRPRRRWEACILEDGSRSREHRARWAQTFRRL